MKHLTAIFIFWLLFMNSTMNAQDIAILKYPGGGDWYANPTALPNLIKFCNANIGTQIGEKPGTVEANNSLIFQYPLLHMTGHGNVVFTDVEIENLRQYLLGGGFLHIDDNYGMKPYVIREIARLFPSKSLEELGADHPLFSQEFKFNQGLPKIHEHDGNRPQALGIFHNNRLVLLLTVESDLGDGWEDPAVHNDSEEVRANALKMGANIISYVFKS